MKDILGTVITYNADVDLLKDNIDSAARQISRIIVYDNASSNIKTIRECLSEFDNVELVENQENDGLPVNYNKATKRAVDLGYEWLLILDQDTVLPDNYIEKAREHLKDENIAIICPKYHDANLGKEIVSNNPAYEETSFIDECISSGSLCRVKIITELGGFDEKMFIDYVDYDYCRTVKENGYKILQLNACVMEHRIGEAEIVSLLGRPQIIHNHSPFRKYYFFRNKIYYARKHNLTFKNNKSYHKQYLKNFVLVLYEKKNKPKKIMAVLKGVHDGFKMKIEK